jgi:hypothetical protein
MGLVFRSRSERYKQVQCLGREKLMRFARWVFLIAGIYGLFLIIPQYFYEPQLARNFPPALTHPEYFYGFVGVTLAWQVLFLILSSDPLRYRLVMLPAILEKVTYGIATIVLYLQQRAGSFVLFFGLIDLIFGFLFILAFWFTRDHPSQ